MAQARFFCGSMPCVAGKGSRKIKDKKWENRNKWREVPGKENAIIYQAIMYGGSVVVGGGRSKKKRKKFAAPIERCSSVLEIMF